MRSLLIGGVCRQLRKRVSSGSQLVSQLYIGPKEDNVYPFPVPSWDVKEKERGGVGGINLVYGRREKKNVIVCGGCGSRAVKVSDRDWHCHEFEPSTTKDPPCRAAMHVKSVESSNVFRWCGSQERRVLAQVSFTSLDHSSK
ncbi:hypothetical protein TNCV_576871 [Trichonephila clavipes]|nr:hypothetical protein TNCV_576871 [Trichonephila clavipes]